MTILDTAYYKRGDRVYAQWRGSYFEKPRIIPGRVIDVVDEVGNTCFCGITCCGPEYGRASEGNFTKTKRVKLAINLPASRTFSQRRPTPAGTPAYWTFHPTYVRLLAHDPNWHPFKIRPFLTPDQFRPLGAYICTDLYGPGEPVWVWEDGWREAIVVNTNNWVSVRYLNGFADRKGNRAKSYRTCHVWPALCDFPQPVQNLTLVCGCKSPTEGAECAISHVRKRRHSHRG